MKRSFVCALLALLALALTVPASVSAASHPREVTAASAPKVSFTVRTVNGKPKKVKRFKANGLDFTCTNGSTGTTTEPAKFPRNMRVNKRRKFHGKARIGELTMAVKGKVRRKGRARGTVRLFGPSVVPGVSCDTGHLRWRVRRN